MDERVTPPETDRSRDRLDRGTLYRFGGLIFGAFLFVVAIAQYGSFSQSDALDARNRIGLARFALVMVDDDRDIIQGQLYGLALGESVIGADRVAAYQAELETRLTDITSQIELAASGGANADLDAMIVEAYPEVATYVDASRDLAGDVGDLTSSDAAAQAAAAAKLATWHEAYDDLTAVLEEIAPVAKQVSDDSVTNGQSTGTQVKWLITVGALFSFALLILVWRKLFKSVDRTNAIQVEVDLATEREREQSTELTDKVDAVLVTIDRAAAGDLTAEVTVDGTDAIGRMGAGLRKLMSDLRSSVALIARNSESLASAAEELQVVSVQMGANSVETSNQADIVSNASTEVSHSVETVSAGAEEMSTSIKEIARNASEAARVAAQAVEAARATNDTVAQLGESSAEIGQIVKVITGIAEQTNLLALNATIEAARAGEAGKGFAVVANEVKDLAKETASATDDITAKIAAIQADTQRSVDSIGGILVIIDQIAEFQDTIAAAVEQQSATTSEIARSVNDASRGTLDITSNINAVAHAAQATATGAADSQRAATELARMAADLQQAVGAFTY